MAARSNGDAPAATSWPTAPSGSGNHSPRSHQVAVSHPRHARLRRLFDPRGYWFGVVARFGMSVKVLTDLEKYARLNAIATCVLARVL